MNAGDSIPAVDGLMAAAAIVNGLVFVTRNSVDVAGTSVRVIDPFEPSP